jgi:hypothetical protein
MMRNAFSLTLQTTVLLLVLVTLGACRRVRWPYDPGNVTYELGNNYGEYQNYGGGAYYHDGIDILAGAPRAAYAVADGTITHISDDGGGLYSGIMIGQPVAGGRGYLYWHIDSASIAVAVGDVLSAGDYIGDVVSWPVANFHHIHFNKVRGTGGYPWGWYASTGNPVSYLTPNTDNEAPVFENAGAGVPFLFCQNETSNYLNPNNLRGQVDIIARIRDKFNVGTAWDMIPYSITLRIKNVASSSQVLNRISAFFGGELGAASTVVNAIYKDDATADSQGDYNTRIFYFVVTNTDGDLQIEATDNAQSWDTTAVGNGNYEITVEARDRSGNVSTTSMIVTVNN